MQYGNKSVHVHVYVYMCACMHVCVCVCVIGFTGKINRMYKHKIKNNITGVMCNGYLFCIL